MALLGNAMVEFGKGYREGRNAPVGDFDFKGFLKETMGANSHKKKTASTKDKSMEQQQRQQEREDESTHLKKQ